MTTHFFASVTRRLPTAYNRNRGEWEIWIEPADHLHGPVTGELKQNGPGENDLVFYRGVFVNLDSAIHEVAEFTGQRIWEVTDPLETDEKLRTTYQIGRPDKLRVPQFATVRQVGGKLGRSDRFKHTLG